MNFKTILSFQTLGADKKLTSCKSLKKWYLKLLQILENKQFIFSCITYSQPSTYSWVVAVSYQRVLDYLAESYFQTWGDIFLRAFLPHSR